MKTYKAYFSISKNAEHRAFLNFIKNLGLDIQTGVASSFSPAKALLADIIFVDEITVSMQDVALSEIKKMSHAFLPVLLLASEKTNIKIGLPACIDDVIFMPFSQILWEKRLATYMQLREKEINIFTGEENEFKALFTESHSIMWLVDPETGKIEDANRAACKFYGYSYRKMISMKVQQINLLKEEQLIQALANAGSNKKNYFVFEHRLADGSVKTVEVYSGKVNHKGKPLLYSIIHDITEAKKTEKLLRESEENYRLLYEKAPFAIFTAQPNGTILDANPMLLKIVGSPSREATKKINVLHFPPLVKAGYVQHFKECITTGQTIRFTTDYTSKWEKSFVAESIFVPLKDDKGDIQKIYVILRDITKQYQAEQWLKESENKYRSLAEISIDMILTYDLQGKITYVNPVVEKISGYTQEEVIGKDFINFISPEYVDLALSSFQKGKQLDTIPIFELELTHKSGRKVPIELNPTSTYNTVGEITGSLTIVRDITVRKEAEKALRESEKKYKEQSYLFRLMSDNIPDLVWSKDMEGRFTFANKAICRKLLIARDTAEPVGKRDPYFAERQRNLHPGRKNWYTFDKLYAQSDALVLKTKRPVRTNEFGYVQGKFLYLDVYKAPIFDENNQIIGIVGHGRDITKEKEADKALLLRDKALNAAANAIIITNADGEIEWVNEAFTKLSGYSEKEVLGKFTIDLVGTGKQDKSFYENVHNILKSGQVWAGEFNDRRKNGSLYEVEEVITPVIDKNGKVEHLIGIMNDISARKTAERELLAAKETAEESSRLKSAFLANMNHEIRTPMNAIMGFSDLMLEATPEEKVNYAKIVNNSAGQLLHLIDDVIFLSRLQSEKLPVRKVIFSPANLINDILFMFDLPEMKKDLEFQTQFPENAGSIAMEADADKIRQVLTSFISNAIKYTEKGYVKLGFEVHSSHILFFEKDSGMGIPKIEQQRIFEAFFRGSKAVSSAIRGTGLGLNIAKELVGLMGGTIGVSSQPGKGSQFYFSLPYKIPKSTLAKAPARQLKPKKWKELNILIAEDDETNFLYLEVLLREKVNRVDRALNGQEAVDMVRKKSYDLVLMDLKMPVMTGTEATLKIKKQYPSLPVIATTAYATPEEKEHALDAGCDDYLSKPIKSMDITSLINKYVCMEN